MYLQSAGSRTATTIFIFFGICIGMFALNAVQQTASRLTWSFARDDGLLLSRFLSRIHPWLEVPVWSLVANWVCIALTGGLLAASTTGMEVLDNISN